MNDTVAATARQLNSALELAAITKKQLEAATQQRDSVIQSHDAVSNELRIAVEHHRQQSEALQTSHALTKQLELDLLHTMAKLGASEREHARIVSEDKHKGDELVRLRSEIDVTEDEAGRQIAAAQESAANAISSNLASIGHWFVHHDAGSSASLAEIGREVVEAVNVPAAKPPTTNSWTIGDDWPLPPSPPPPVEASCAGLLSVSAITCSLLRTDLDKGELARRLTALAGALATKSEAPVRLVKFVLARLCEQTLKGTAVCGVWLVALVLAQRWGLVDFRNDVDAKIVASADSDVLIVCRLLEPGRLHELTREDGPAYRGRGLDISAIAEGVGCHHWSQHGLVIVMRCNQSHLWTFDTSTMVVRWVDKACCHQLQKVMDVGIVL